jgi:hypothetical protein
MSNPTGTGLDKKKKGLGPYFRYKEGRYTPESGGSSVGGQ